MKCPDCGRESTHSEACVCGWQSDAFKELSAPKKRHVKAFIDEERHLIDYFERQKEV